MRKITDLLVLLCLFLGIAVTDSCKKDIVLAVLTTNAATEVTINSATSGGVITSNGGADITAKGVCWSTTQNPTISDSHTSDGPGSASFTSELTDLTPNTLYYVKAYATNSAGTAYGNQVSFTTTAIVKATVTTTEISAITLTSAVSGGNVTADGGGAVTARGVCWATTAEPTIDDSSTSNGAGTGSFTSELASLLPGTTYHVRAYATNTAGTGYGDELTFTTTAIGVPILTTTEATSITLTSAASGGNITNSGGADVTARGVCWSTSANPTIDDDITTDGSGTGTFTSNITPLLPGTTYHVRAYATNSSGTGYGSDLTFTTTAVGSATLTTDVVTSITFTTAQSGGDITDDGGGNITARGVCWSTTTEPTTAGSKTTDGTGTGTFTSDLTSLVQNTTYYVRAYATNEAGTAYGNEVSFTTDAVSLSTLTTTAVTSVTATTALSGGNITDAGGGNVSARGVCWATTTGPTIADNKTTDATGTGSFTSNVTLLAANTTYYLRAYATNEAGTNYGDEATFKTFAATDIDGNNYNSVLIGSQTWLAENLKTTKYRNGDPIGTTTTPTQDISGFSDVTSKFQWPVNNDVNNVTVYGRFYTMFAITDSRNVCPTGWHVPSDTEWESLKTFLGGVTVAGGKLKETGTTHWNDPNTGATNDYGFTAVGGGYRMDTGPFVSFGIGSPYWSSTPNALDVTLGWGQRMYNYDATLVRGGFNKHVGCAVRCLKD